MDGFTAVDGVVLAVILISAILAYSRGFVREVLAILGWAAAAVAAFFLTPFADEPYFFSHWVGVDDDFGPEGASVTMDADRVVEVWFE